LLEKQNDCKTRIKCISNILACGTINAILAYSLEMSK
jgi:hypothetical protein